MCHVVSFIVTHTSKPTVLFVLMPHNGEKLHKNESRILLASQSKSFLAKIMSPTCHYVRRVSSKIFFLGVEAPKLEKILVAIRITSSEYLRDTINCIT